MYCANDIYEALVSPTGGARFESIRSTMIAEYGYDTWREYYRKALLRLNAQPYNFPSFDAKVSKSNADKSYIQAIKPGHNED